MQRQIPPGRAFSCTAPTLAPNLAGLSVTCQPPQMGASPSSIGPRIIKGRPFRVGCGCCAEQSTPPDERNTRWNGVKYLGFDVHQTTISVAVVNADGKLVMESVIATHALPFSTLFRGLRGTLHLTFEEGTHSA